MTQEIPISDFSSSAAAAALWTREHISAESLEFLSGRPASDPERDPGLYHGSPRDPVWEYVLSSWQADECMDLMSSRVAAIGHSHVALWFGRAPSGEVDGGQAADCDEADLSAGEWLINPGSVGQPRDGDPRAAWLLLDTGGWPRAGTASNIRSTRPPVRSRRRDSRRSSLSGCTADSDQPEANNPRVAARRLPGRRRLRLRRRGRPDPGRFGGRAAEPARQRPGPARQRQRGRLRRHPVRAARPQRRTRSTRRSRISPTASTRTCARRYRTASTGSSRWSRSAATSCARTPSRSRRPRRQRSRPS